MFITILITLVIGIVLGALLLYLVTRKNSEKFTPPETRAEFSAKEVEELLKRSGYQVLSKRPQETIITSVNGKEYFGKVEADYLVKKNKATFVVLIKRAGEVADPEDPILRKKLLELKRVFSLEMIYLNMEQGEINHINFRFPHERNIDFFFRFIMALFIIAAVIAIIWLLAHLRFF